MSSATTEYPNNLTAAEHHELRTGSAIHPALIERNFFHIEGETIYDYLFISNKIPRKNAGRVTDAYIRQYQHLLLGGTWIQSLDPFKNWQPMDWGRIKPNFPRIDWQKGKPVKYESPPKTPNRVTYFDVANPIWDKVAKRYLIKRYHSLLALRLLDKLNPLIFWEWIKQHPEIPIILCEGEKKAACLLSLGFVAIALPGIWNGRVGQQDFDERLHPDLVPMAQAGRKFIILFDHETKAKTRWLVFQATVRTAKAIESAGCFCEVALLPGPEKGVDDFVVSRGVNANALLTAIIDDAKSLKDYKRSYRAKKWGLSKYQPDVTVNVLYLSEALCIPELEEKCLRVPELYDLEKEQLFTPSIKGHPPNKESTDSGGVHSSKSKKSPTFNFPKSGLVVLWSDMGTGKTELMRWWRDQNPNARFLNNGHRVNLLKNLAERLRTAMYSDLGYTGLAQAPALSITIDSLHKLNTQSLTYGCIFIDEACQYLTHLLHSNTCKQHRAAILEVLEYIVYNAPLVVIADAHMDDLTVNFFLAMRPKGEVPYIIKNEWRNGERTIYWYEGDNESALVAQISAALMLGEKVMVASDSKRFIKKLDKSFTIKCEESNSEKSHTPQKWRIWSVHSDNSGSDENVAFIKDITNAVKNFDALFTSPSLGTGVDISQYHFDLVFGVFHGVSQTATECAQQLYRYRPKVPFHIWVAPRPPFGYQDTNAAKIKERLLQTNEMTAFLLRIDRQTGKRGAEKDWALEAYCQIMANRHYSLNNLRDDLRSLLTEMGNTFICVGSDSDPQSLESLKAAAQALDRAHNSAVAKAKNITLSEYRARQSKDYLDPNEIFECEKFRISDSYGIEVTESLVEMDKGGRLIRAIAGLEAILAPPEESFTDPKTGQIYPTPPTIVTQKDRTERDNLPLCIDWGNYSARWLARFNLGLHQILASLMKGDEVTADDPTLLKMTEIAIHCAAHVKAILGFTIPLDCKPIWLLATLVEQLGLKLTFRKQGKRGQQVKLFSLSKEELEFALQVIAHRVEKRNQKENRTYYAAQNPAAYSVSPNQQPVSTPPPDAIGNSHCQGEDTTEFESPPTDRVTLLHCVEILRSGIKQGVDAIKGILKRWVEDLRWDTVLELEAIAPDELRLVEDQVPEFYALLNEEVLPMEG
ncbi:plasmid replication protein, CyRepA1 family [Nostoc sp. 'Lobaria pulmonaria (5183) cyanobiont']|uniref:plasmid replication protein, CyRepA1 family n=1 Tax=Nostoc sp. 'Lobaria pulmonaria (5183) cyanobiont' TaxID=1618022 RepID=UPI000CF327F1|nr:plasmid replication protein, CyRepA1 family [Nostoc sp. 'Lobaria pulmonaria (5183) cyanobiont']AVH74296.1 topoisomerase-primase [Nostoc sp. 'Lobaria pulmonaria (5183) cyanobiont']